MTQVRRWMTINTQLPYCANCGVGVGEPHVLGCIHYDTDAPVSGGSEVDKVRAAYLHDPSVSEEHYVRLIEAADETDRAREAAAEKPDNDEENA